MLRQWWRVIGLHPLLSLSCPTAVCNVLYGKRLGLLQDFIDPEAQKFIDAVTLMFHTTSPMLYIPPSLLRRINSKTWQDHVQAWDVIFMHGEPPLPPCPPHFHDALLFFSRCDSLFRWGGIHPSLLHPTPTPHPSLAVEVGVLLQG